MEVIAERTLEFMESGTTHPHTIRIMLGKPIRVVFDDSDPLVPSEPRPLAPGEPEPEDRCCWGAPFAISGPVGAVSERCMLGEDSMQALMLAIRIIPSFLEANFLSRGTLTCDGAPWDLGLSVQLEERGA
ncbi:MAG: DUF6968 family protein [Byssovorax sp.]